MGLLDDLKQQAHSLRVEQQASSEQRNQQLQAAHDKLNETLHYWVDLFNSLNVIKPPVPRYFYLDGGAIQLENLLQCDYNVNGRRRTVDHRDYIDAVVLRFRCVSGEKLKVEKESDALVQRMREHLWSHALKFEVDEIRERGYLARGTFTIHPEVPVTVTIESDSERSQVKISTRNLEKLGEYEYVFDLDEYGTPVLEELAKLILGKPNAMRSSGRHQAAARSPRKKTAPGSREQQSFSS